MSKTNLNPEILGIMQRRLGQPQQGYGSDISPAMSNYMQSQMNPQQNLLMGEMQDPFAALQKQQMGSTQAPQAPRQAPQMQQPMQPPAQGQQAPYNPFDAGIRKAIESARESMQMTDKQQDRAMRQSMLAFGENIGQQPKERGFWNNLGSAARALGPALSAYDQEEAASEAQNNAAAQQILAYQAAEQKAAQDQEEREWHRGHAEAQLGEQRRSHNLMDAFRRDQLGGRNEVEERKLNNASWLMQQKQNTSKAIPEISANYTRNNEILPTIDDLGKILSNSKLAGGSKAAEIKRWIAKQTGTDEDVLNANNMGQFYFEWMKSVTSGAISDRDMKEYQRTFATIDKNPKAAVQTLDRLKKKLSSQNARFVKQLDAYNEDAGTNLSSRDYLDPMEGQDVLPTQQMNEPSNNDLEDIDFVED
jgi:hypothetical protein